ncbi:hypothetical protein EIN_082960 [Entamoeba invadens IP1]|uniref:hypothetical protein n=1 Tax=Entamoeba invadens IP1 TaxID=370355 RepID=UPI0002C3F65F|nr:hypothetical protein EIN_082960 [Entamoeba invadens IP1]ELP85184.1 hypothetical protein EIN_082960 [Entamoeba invadens IP1]|eukprot:XP_004184530.1 hypothetical protein EIN_082960 [Entamoeba invadens IP1]
MYEQAINPEITISNIQRMEGGKVVRGVDFFSCTVNKFSLVFGDTDENVSVKIENFKYIASLGIMNLPIDVKCIQLKTCVASVNFKLQNVYGCGSQYSNDIISLSGVVSININNGFDKSQLRSDQVDVLLFCESLKPRNMKRFTVTQINSVNVNVLYSFEDIFFLQRMVHHLTDKTLLSSIFERNSGRSVHEFFNVPNMTMNFQELKETSLYPHSRPLIFKGSVFGHTMMTYNEKEMARLAQIGIDASYEQFNIFARVNVNIGNQKKIIVPFILLKGVNDLETVYMLVNQLQVMRVLIHPYNQKTNELPQKVECDWKTWFGKDMVKCVRVDDVLTHETLYETIQHNKNNLKVIDETSIFLGEGKGASPFETRFVEVEVPLIHDAPINVTPIQEQVIENTDGRIEVEIKCMNVDAGISQENNGAITIITQLAMSFKFNKNGIVFKIQPKQIEVKSTCDTTSVLKITNKKDQQEVIEINGGLNWTKPIDGANNEMYMTIYAYPKNATLLNVNLSMSVGMQIKKMMEFKVECLPDFIKNISQPFVFNVAKIEVKLIRTIFQIKVCNLDLCSTKEITFEEKEVCLKNIVGDAKYVFISLLAKVKDQMQFYILFEEMLSSVFEKRVSEITDIINKYTKF